MILKNASLLEAFAWLILLFDIPYIFPASEDQNKHEKITKFPRLAEGTLFDRSHFFSFDIVHQLDIIH